MSDVLRSVFSGGGASVAPPHGLVSLETSFQGIEIDPVQSRLNRMRSAVRTSARLIESEVRALPIQYRSYMVTLTYRPGVEWGPYHISNCLGCYRNWAKENGFFLRYVWVAEIQANRYQNGALLGECVHYHLLIWVPAHLYCPKPDKVGFWGHGMTQTVVARKPVSYLTKYATKGKDVFFPKGLRTHGAGGLSATSRLERTWWSLPRWVRILFDQSAIPRRQKGGGFISRASGVVLKSIWSVLNDGGTFFCWLRDDLHKILSPFQLWQLAIAGVIPERWGDSFEQLLDHSVSCVECPF